jgi:hypothetical protein
MFRPQTVIIMAASQNPEGEEIYPEGEVMFR